MPRSIRILGHKVDPLVRFRLLTGSEIEQLAIASHSRRRKVFVRVARRDRLAAAVTKVRRALGAGHVLFVPAKQSASSSKTLDL